MRLKGKVLRPLGPDPGLAIIEGRQYRFTAAEWRSVARPFPGMEVEALLDDNHQITEIAFALEGRIRHGHSQPAGLARILQWLTRRAKRNGGERRS